MEKEQSYRMVTEQVDLEALVCLDMAHQWRLVEDSVRDKGPMKGCPARIKLCMVCGGMKVETMSWRGEILGRKYESAKDYIENCRKLGPVNDRRRAYRELILKRDIRKPRGLKLCQVCAMPLELEGYVHDDCE